MDNPFARDRRVQSAEGSLGCGRESASSPGPTPIAGSPDTDRRIGAPSSARLTLRTYSRVLPDREEALSFADFVGVSGAPQRLQAAPQPDATPEAESAPGITTRERSRNLERETGFEPATLSLGKRAKA